ncbi:hypothetical protein J6590_036101 [Homalodisca vitripennis]|nr:hypothetical protein J6590_036101 [Homalodisca vitripennis]
MHRQLIYLGLATDIDPAIRAVIDYLPPAPRPPSATHPDPKLLPTRSRFGAASENDPEMLGRDDETPPGVGPPPRREVRLIAVRGRPWGRRSSILMPSLKKTSALSKLRGRMDILLSVCCKLGRRVDKPRFWFTSAVHLGNSYRKITEWLTARQRRAWLLLGWVTAERSCPCKHWWLWFGSQPELIVPTSPCKQRVHCLESRTVLHKVICITKASSRLTHFAIFAQLPLPASLSVLDRGCGIPGLDRKDCRATPLVTLVLGRDLGHTCSGMPLSPPPLTPPPRRAGSTVSGRTRYVASGDGRIWVQIGGYVSSVASIVYRYRPSRRMEITSVQCVQTYRSYAPPRAYKAGVDSSDIQAHFWNKTRIRVIIMRASV